MKNNKRNIGQKTTGPSGLSRKDAADAVFKSLKESGFVSKKYIAALKIDIEQLVARQMKKKAASTLPQTIVLVANYLPSHISPALAKKAVTWAVEKWQSFQKEKIGAEA